MEAYARNKTEVQAWSREVSIVIDGTTYYGTLFHSDWDGYDWDGDEVPGVEMDNDWFYELDGATCDADGCFACAERKGA